MARWNQSKTWLTGPSLAASPKVRGPAAPWRSSGRRRPHRGVGRPTDTGGEWPSGSLIDQDFSAPMAAGMGGMSGMGRTKEPAAANRPGLFNRPLPIPAELVGMPTAAANGPNYVLRMAPGRTSLVAGRVTPTWGCNAPFLGPTLRIPRGKPVRLDIENALNQSTTTHWHGAQVPGVMDGGPQGVISVGKTYHYAFTLDQPAATLWYTPLLRDSGLSVCPRSGNSGRSERRSRSDRRRCC